MQIHLFHIKHMFCIMHTIHLIDINHIDHLYYYVINSINTIHRFKSLGKEIIIIKGITKSSINDSHIITITNIIIITYNHQVTFSSFACPHHYHKCTSTTNNKRNRLPISTYIHTAHNSHHQVWDISHKLMCMQCSRHDSTSMCYHWMSEVILLIDPSTYSLHILHI